LNQQGSNLPLPPPPAATGNPAEAAAAQADAPAQGDMGSEQPQLNAQTTPRSEGTVKGPAAPDTSGQAGQDPH
ncbi:MAG: hypothetical protein M3177_03415, partial [Pseudomonadota bacterium]|nr:hypothetical protein [Pseudomonadota bacterium]